MKADDEDPGDEPPPTRKEEVEEEKEEDPPDEEEPPSASKEEEDTPVEEKKEDAPVEEEKEDEQRPPSSRRILDFEHQNPIYTFMFLFLLPVLWAIFIGIGWSNDDKVEDQVSNIWTRQRSSYAKDLDYARKYDRDSLGSTVFAAMAIARDGENLFTKERLEEVRARMEEAESTTVNYKGITYTWDDICASNNVGLGTAYKFPCVRLSPMDFFEEARWFMDEEDRVTWYQEVVRKIVVAPRLPRFGIMQNACSNLVNPAGRIDCNNVILHRMFQGEPILLLADIGNLENNDPCKQCIEEEFEAAMTQYHQLTQTMFGGLYQVAVQSEQTELAEQYTNVLAKLDRQAVVDYWSYYVTRGLYVSLGEAAYMGSRDQFNMAISGCMNPGAGIPCPAPTTKEEAKAALANHADHAFSSIVTSGNPLPVWGDDGEGYLLQGLSPVSGSGIDMSGSMFSALSYLAAPDAASWEELVEGDPVYAWFIASETLMTGHCGNGFLKGTNGMGAGTDGVTGSLMETATQQWCTKYNEPFEEDGVRTVQYFARMWYNLLVDSPNFLRLVQGETDPYVWTTGQGCGYNLAGSRYSYTTATSTEELMGNVSGELYYIDEGESVGVIDRNLLMGGRTPRDYDLATPLREVSVIQSIYPALLPDDIIKRVKNCNRPDGSVDISLDDAEEVLYRFKEKFEDTWTKGWDNKDAGNVSFVGFFDDSGVVGTTGRMLKEITLSNGDLVAVSMGIIAVFSVLFVLTFDPVESRIMITVLGVFLVIFAFFAAVGFGLIVGIKLNITIAWTLPFIMLGLGVDDMYMVLLAIRNQKGYELEDFLAAIQEVAVPITMTSVVNAGMFALMNISDVPAVFLTAQVALISVIFLYLTIMFCFTAWCYLDMRRQRNNRFDVFVCFKGRREHREQSKMWASFFYDRIYKPFLLESTSGIVVWSHLFIWLVAATLLGLGIWGLTEDQRAVGLGLEDFFPEDNQASQWATMRTAELASWSIQLNFGAVDISNPSNQMRLIKIFEDVVDTPNVAGVDTKQLWIADFTVWTTHQCTENFDRDDAEVLECGINQVYPADNTTCTGIWTPNVLGLREKVFSDVDTCIPFEGGVCRPTAQMHPADLALVDDEDASDSWCPVVDRWDNDKLRFCLGKWRELTGSDGRLVLMNETGTPAECEGEFLNDEVVQVPVPYSVGPTMFAFDLFTHEVTIDMIEETRAICDDDPDIHCWLSGIPYSYWSQYIEIYGTFWEIGAISVAAGFGVSFLFLAVKLMIERRHTTRKVLVGSLIGSSLIAITCILSLVCVSGLSALFDVSFTGFSIMSFVLSVGFAVEYSVHIVAHWLLASASFKTSLERVEHAMEFLFLPTFMSFVSSTIGVACLAFTDFEFNEVFFFRPLIIVMFVTYFYGCWWLPVFLVLLDFDTVKFGCDEEEGKSENVVPSGKDGPSGKEGGVNDEEEVASSTELPPEL